MYKFAECSGLLRAAAGMTPPKVDEETGQNAMPSQTIQVAGAASTTPISSAVRSEVQGMVPTGATEGSGRILVVDDETLVRQTVLEILERAGYLAVGAGSAAIALELLDTGASFDLLLTDQTMPGITGIDLISQVEHRFPLMATLLMSGYALDRSLDCATKHASVLAKPFRQRTLLDRISQLLEERSATRRISGAIPEDLEKEG